MFSLTLNCEREREREIRVYKIIIRSIYSVMLMLRTDDLHLFVIWLWKTIYSIMTVIVFR